MLWSQLLQNRSDLTALRQIAPELVAELELLRSELDRSGERGSTALPAGQEADQLVDKRMREARRFDELLDEVRRIPGYADFLAPVPFHELRQAAQAGPVIVVNISAYRCDAVIVTLDGVRIVPLTDITFNDCANRANKFLAALHDASNSQQHVSVSSDLNQVLAW